MILTRDEFNKLTHRFIIDTEYLVSDIKDKLPEVVEPNVIKAMTNLAQDLKDYLHWEKQHG